VGTTIVAKHLGDGKRGHIGCDAPSQLRLILRQRGVEQRCQQSIAKVRAEAQAKMLEWERTMAAWRQLYYCGRDDIVPVERMAQIFD
jgi:hypothetical protein